MHHYQIKKKPTRGFSNEVFEIPGWLVLLPADPNYRKTGNPTAMIKNLLSNPMLPLSLLNLQPVQRGASPCLPPYRTSTLYQALQTIHKPEFERLILVESFD